MCKPTRRTAQQTEVSPWHRLFRKSTNRAVARAGRTAIDTRSSYLGRLSSSSSVSKKKRGRPRYDHHRMTLEEITEENLRFRLYERDPFTNKPKKSHATPEKAEVPAPTLTTATVLIPKTTNNFHNLQPAAPSYNSIIFPRQTVSRRFVGEGIRLSDGVFQTTIPMMNTSLLQAPQYSYPSLLNNPNPSTNNTFVGSNFSIYSSPANPPNFCYSSSPTVFSHPPAVEPAPMVPLKSLQIPTASAPVVSASSSPRRSVNSDVAVHYIGGYVIRECSHPFSPRDKIEQKENPHLQCIMCRTVESSERFFDRERPFCSQFCSVKFNEKSLDYDKPSFTNEPTGPRETLVSPSSTHSNTDEQATPAIDRGLPADPGKWTVRNRAEGVREKKRWIVILGLSRGRIRHTFDQCEHSWSLLREWNRWSSFATDDTGTSPRYVEDQTGSIADHRQWNSETTRASQDLLFLDSPFFFISQYYPRWMIVLM